MWPWPPLSPTNEAPGQRACPSPSAVSNSHLISFTTSRCELLVTMVPFTCWGTKAIK